MSKNATQETAKKTADLLLSEGIKPTQQNVRARMGTGSITTINKALNEWWQELGQRLKANTSHPAIPDPVAESASKLWHQALAYADKSLEDKHRRLEQDFIEKKRKASLSSNQDQQELKELRAQCLRLLQDIERLTSEKYELQGRNSQLETEVIKLQSSNDSLERELKQSQLVGNTGKQIDLDEYIELQVSNRTLSEENKRLNKQLELITNEKAQLLNENIQLKQQI